ncbi:MAG: molybdopterin cofactor-binding domain-containing protein [Nocardioidaceae bacterium]
MTVDTSVSSGRARVEGVDKVTGSARYAYEYAGADALYAWIVPATIAAGTVTAIDAGPVAGTDGVVAVLTHDDAPRLADTGSAFTRVLQGPEVAFRGQVVALVVAETPEGAREAAARLDVRYEESGHDVVLTADHRSLYKPEGRYTDTSHGDADGAFAGCPAQVDATYRIPPLHNNAMEPHATTASWDDGRLTVYDSDQGGNVVRTALATAFGLEQSDVRVVNAHVGGGFGSKGTPRAGVVLAAMAARVVGRPVKLALTRQQMFDLAGYRSPTIQRVRLGADVEGRLVSISHDGTSQTATVEEFVEQCVGPTRVMYAAPHRSTTQRVARLDVSLPSWMRAPGECSGMFALETAMDELAVATGVDPVELRIRNDAPEDPERGLPFSSRHLVECLRLGAERFGWGARDPVPGSVRDGRWLVGSGVAASTYPASAMPSSARAAVDAEGMYTVSVNATDIGTGARTALLDLAVEALAVEPSRVRILIGDTSLPEASLAGGSMGMTSWGWAVVKACRELRAECADRPVPADGFEVQVSTADDLKAREKYSRHAFGAQFVEVGVDVDTGEVRARRMVGVFAAGRIVNERTARSQFLGGMTMGLSMALHEGAATDVEFGGFANHDLATYHVAANADVDRIEVEWIDEHDPHLGPTGTKGIGEIGIVGAAAAVGNAIHHATGIRLRETPMTPDRLLPGLPRR